MKSVSLLFILSFFTIKTLAQKAHPVIPETGETAKSFVPNGWKIISQTIGDLNKDALADEAIVIENTDPKNIIANQEGAMGGDKLNINPRMLLILFKTKNGNYQLAVKNIGFIPIQNDIESRCLLDPLFEGKGVSIKKGVLKVQYQYFYSCGGCEVNRVGYTFRFQNQQFELIGYDYFSMHRASGEETSYSVDLYMLKKKSIIGGNVFSEEKHKPKTIWNYIAPIQLIGLENLTTDRVNNYLSRVKEIH